MASSRGVFLVSSGFDSFLRPALGVFRMQSIPCSL